MFTATALHSVACHSQTLCCFTTTCVRSFSLRSPHSRIFAPQALVLILPLLALRRGSRRAPPLARIANQSLTKTVRFLQSIPAICLRSQRFFSFLFLLVLSGIQLCKVDTRAASVSKLGGGVRLDGPSQLGHPPAVRYVTAPPLPYGTRQQATANHSMKAPHELGLMPFFSFLITRDSIRTCSRWHRLSPKSDGVIAYNASR
jgi:hypothetical protein